MPLRTLQVEIGGKQYTATEPMCADYEALIEGQGRNVLYGSAVEFLLSCLRVHHPDVTPEAIKAGMPPRLLTAAVDGLMKLGGAKESAPGEGASA